MQKTKNSKLDLNKMKKVLMELKENFEKENTIASSPVSEHENNSFSDASDLATHDTDLSNDLSVKQLKNLKYTEILEALQRIENGEYGVCDDCGAEIGVKRLEVYPTSKMCIVCQEEHEKEQKSKNLAKSVKVKDQDKTE